MNQDPGSGANADQTDVDPTSGTAPSETDKRRGGGVNPAGPHARPDLTDEDKTPGTGMLPEPGTNNPSPTG
jgi:hypothetical protein